MIITGIDLETTGVDTSKGDRIIEIALVSVVPKDGKLAKVGSLTRRCNPQRPIHPDAQAVHHISDRDVMGEPLFKDIAPDVLKVLEKTDLLVAHNMGFDGVFLATELMNASKAVPSFQTFCTMENGRWATPTGKSPKLKELCFALGVTYDESKAHAAEYDILVTLQCLKRGMDRGFYKLPLEFPA